MDYTNYWTGQTEFRSKRSYYQRLYGRLKHQIEFERDARILDVAGGNGQLMQYLGVKVGDVLDISPSGLEAARDAGFNTILGDIQKRFPIPEESYDSALLFEVLEHLLYPNKTLVEIHNILKVGGTLYIGQPNMRADGVHHVRRYYLQALLNDITKAGFSVDWIDYVPAYSMRDSILSDIRNNQSLLRKAIQCINLTLSYLPWEIRYKMAQCIPDRFALLFVVKATKGECA